MLAIARESLPQAPRRPERGVGPWRPVVARTCIDCGLCVPVCPTNVFAFAPGRRHLDAPRAEACLGTEACGICVPACPARAIAIEPNPSWEALGDAAWTNAMIVSTREAGEHGARSKADPVAAGATSAGFDRLGLVVPEGAPILVPDEVDLYVPLHHRGRARRVELPVLGGDIGADFSAGPVALARAAAAQALGTITTATPEALAGALAPYAAALALPIDGHGAGVPDALLTRARAITLRYTSAPFAGTFGLDDMKAQLEWLTLVNPEALLMVEISASADAPSLAVGAAHAGAHAIYLNARRDMGLPLPRAIGLAHHGLRAESLRDQVALVAGGGVRTPHDVLKAVALGADACATDVAELVALGGVPTPYVEGGISVPVDVDPEWAARRLVNMGLAWAAEWRRALALLSLGSIRALRGRADLLAWVGE